MSSFPDFDEASGAATPPKPPIPEFVPPTEINLETELLAQYVRAQRLLHEASYDDTIPLSQKAQTINSATSILGALTKSQAELYSTERIKKIERCLVETLKKFPEMQANFFALYEEALND